MMIRDERAGDENAREDLLDSVFGAERHEKTCERVREGQAPAHGLSLIAEFDGRIVGTVRLWHVKAGERDALLLGPLAVARDCQSLGIGSRLMRAALNRAATQGHQAVILVGDAPYYERFGFARDLTQGLDLPGPVDRARFLALELMDGALAGASGMVVAAGDHNQSIVKTDTDPAIPSLRHAA